MGTDRRPSLDYLWRYRYHEWFFVLSALLLEHN
jgi:hypothetical protein